MASHIDTQYRDMSARGAWPPFPWNPRDLDNPIIGRDASLDALMSAFEDVVSDWTVRVHLLVSEYGMGKTRLVTAFTERAKSREPDTEVIRVRCPDTGGTYRMWDAIFRAAFKITEGSDERAAGAALLESVERFFPTESTTIAGLIGHLVGWPVTGSDVVATGEVDEEALVARCVGAVGRMLESMAFERPHLIIVEGANRASARDFGFASAIEATFTGRPIMMVFVGSPALTQHLPGWDRFPATRLAPLERPDAERMLRLFLSGLETAMPQALVGQVLDNAGGNPYALKSMVRYLMEADGIVSRDGRWHCDEAALNALSIPDNLEGVLLARVSELNEREREVLAQAAVVGREFWLGALVALGREEKAELPAGIDDGDEARRVRRILKKFVSQRFLEARGSRIPGEEAFSFRSDVHWRVAHELLPNTVRTKLHRVVGAWLALHSEGSDSPFLNELARHAEGGGELGQAASYYIAAAKRALGEHHSHEALRCLERASELVQPHQMAERLTILFELGDIHAYAGAPADAKSYYDQAMRLAWRMSDRRRRARALLKLAEVEQSRGEFDAAKGNFENAMRLFELTEDRSGVARSSMLMGQLFWIHGSFDQALRCYRKSEHIYRSLRHDKGLGEIYHSMGSVHYDRGDTAVAERMFQEAAVLRRRAGDRRGLAKTYNNLGIIWMGQRLEKSVEVWKDALIVAREIGDRGLEATLADNLGEASVLLGRYDEAEGYLQRAVHVARISGRKRTLIDALRNLGVLKTALREWAEAEDALALAKSHAAALGVLRLEALVARTIGDLAVAKMEATGVIAESGGPRTLNRAETAYKRAAEAFTEAGYDLEAATSHDRLAEMLELAGRDREATVEREHAYNLRASHQGVVAPPTPPA